MKKSESSSAGAAGGTSVLGLLGIVFIVLKLCHVIAWSWWWVLCPFWGGFAIALFFVMVAIFLAAFSDKQGRKKRQ